MRLKMALERSFRQQADILKCADATDFRGGSNLSKNISTRPWEDDWSPRYNIAPTQPVPVIRQNPKEPVRELSLMKMGTDSIMGERLLRRCRDD